LSVAAEAEHIPTAAKRIAAAQVLIESIFSLSTMTALSDLSKRQSSSVAREIGVADGF
jgi:hypothetical protein